METLLPGIRDNVFKKIGSARSAVNFSMAMSRAFSTLSSTSLASSSASPKSYSRLRPNNAEEVPMVAGTYASGSSGRGQQKDIASAASRDRARTPPSAS